MKILGRIKKSKVLTAVMTAVLIFQSACPTGLAYAAQKSGVSAYAAGQTIDQALGATKTVESVLSQHENDEYYLTTPYGNKGPHGEGGAIDTWDCWKPKGEYGSGAYMNCTGFVVAVLRACGANTSIIGNYTAKDGYNRGNETNASKWDEYCRDNNAVSYTFSSKEQMLASGILEKGDIIYMEPADWNHSNSDCHIGFFWGSNSSEDLFWHSSSHADGIVKGYFPNSAGGNVISKITPKYPVRYYRVIKTLHKGYLTLHKDSSNKTLTDNGIDWSNAKKLPTASIDLAKVKAYAEENKDLLSCLVYKTAEFTPEKESGSIDMDYTFNSNDVIDRLSGETKNLVVFEVMFKGSIENASDETPVSIVASECDKDNEGQTVKLAPSTIGTTATDKSDGDHELMAGKDAVITDEVKYEGLIPGKEYTLHATLMDKKTGEPLKVADKGVTAELKFTPNSESGTVSINLGEFDATSLDGHTLVVFEELTKQSDIDGKATDVTVAEHKDINDEGQSVTVTSTPAGSTYGKTGVDMTNIAIAIGILLIAAGCATAYGIKSRKTTKGDADENAEDNTEA